MLSFIKKHLSPDYLSDSSQDELSKTFVLTYRQKDIGYLKFLKGAWKFWYSDWFKSQTSVLPIPDFPDKAREYESDQLWPFFASRIPSALNRKSPHNENAQSPKNVADLLEDYGKKTINNPFVLEPFENASQSPSASSSPHEAYDVSISGLSRGKPQ